MLSLRAHRAGDQACSKGCGKGGSSPRRKGGSPKKGGRQSSKGKAFLVSEAPLYVSLNDGEGDGYCDMILAGPDEDGDMDQTRGTPSWMRRGSLSSRGAGRRPPRQRAVQTGSWLAKPHRFLLKAARAA